MCGIRPLYITYGMACARINMEPVSVRHFTATVIDVWRHSPVSNRGGITYVPNVKGHSHRVGCVDA